MANDYPKSTMSEATIKAMVEKIKTFTEEREFNSEILTNKDMREFCGCKVNDTYNVIKIQAAVEGTKAWDNAEIEECGEYTGEKTAPFILLSDFHAG